MQKDWEFTQKNVFSELLSLLGRMTQENLTHQIEYLKVENEILRKRIGKCIRPTAVKKRKLLKFAIPLGKDIRNIISIVTYETFLLWVRRYKRKKDSEKTQKRDWPKTLEEIRQLVVRLAKENAWGYVRILGELKKLNINRLSKSSVKNKVNKNSPVPQNPGGRRGAYYFRGPGRAVIFDKGTPSPHTAIGKFERYPLPLAQKYGASERLSVNR